MNNKIIGFTISKKQIDHSDVDVFDVGLIVKHKKVADLNLYYWGIGDIDVCSTNQNTLSLSFPLTDSLLDRNVLIKKTANSITVENVWLSSVPIFYNHNEHIVSTLCTKTIQEQKPTPNPEGINNYLEFGYSVFEQTPVEQVKFLLYN